MSNIPNIPRVKNAKATGTMEIVRTTEGGGVKIISPTILNNLACSSHPTHSRSRKTCDNNKYHNVGIKTTQLVGGPGKSPFGHA